MKKSISLHLVLSLFLSFCISYTVVITSDTDNAHTIHTYFWANYNHFSGNINNAHTWYNHLFSSTDSLYTYKGYLTFLFETKKYKAIIELIPTLDTHFLHDEDIQLTLVRTLEIINKQHEADARIIRLGGTNTKNSEIAFRAAQAYLRTKDAENALHVINTFLNRTPRNNNNFIFYFLKSQIYIFQNKHADALENIQKCLDMHPRFDRGWLALATLQEQQGALNDAIRGYSTFLDLSGKNPEIERHLFNLILTQNNQAKQNQILPNRHSAFESALLYFKHKKYTQALIYADKQLQSDPQDTQTRLLKIQILCALGNIDQALGLIVSWFDYEPDKKIWPHTLFLLMRLGIPRTKIIVTLQALAKKHPNALWPQLYLADLLIRDNNITTAITTLENCTGLLTHSKDLQVKILYQLSILYLEENNYEKMAQALQKAYDTGIKNAHVTNALAYYWATKGKDCNKAQQLVTQAVAHETNNPLYLDTQATIFYKQKKYDQAYKILEKIAPSSHHAIIILHLAKVELARGNKEKAQALTEESAQYAHYNYEKRSVNNMRNRLKK